MIATNWFQKKWGFEDPVLIDELYSRLVDLEQRVKILEDENVELTNELYRMENSLDSRIDIIAERFWIDQDLST